MNDQPPVAPIPAETSARGCGLALGGALFLLVALPITCAVLPLRTLTQIELEVTAPTDRELDLTVELLDDSGKATKPKVLGRVSRSAFSYGSVHAVRVHAPGCKEATVDVGACTEEMHFTDYHRHLHHGSASHYERDCKVTVALECE